MYFPNYFSPCFYSCAVAPIYGGPLAPSLQGMVYFQEVIGGIIVTACIYGLPEYQPPTDTTRQIGPFGFHIHETGCCDIGDPSTPFLCAGGHYNPTNQPHGNHAGDFPVLFSNDGFAYMQFFTNKLTVSEIINRAVIIHQSPDDFQSQPSGNAGKRLGCGLIQYC